MARTRFGKRFGALILSVILCFSTMVLFSGCSSSTYSPQEKNPTIFSPEIGKEGVLRVGVDANSSPFAGATASGVFGINVDIAAAIADEFGLKLEIVDYGSDPAQALSSGTVDIVMGIDKSNLNYDFWTSDSYIESAVALFSTNSGAAMPVQNVSKIAAQVSSMSAWEVNKQFGEQSLVPADSLKDAFLNLSKGAVDYVAADAVIGSYAAYNDGIDVNMIGLLQKPTGYAIGVKSDNNELKQAISNVLLTLSENGMIELIEKKWLGKPIDISTLPLSPAAQAASTPAAPTQTTPDEEPQAESDNQADEAGTDDGTGTSEDSSEGTIDDTIDYISEDDEEVI